MKKGGIIVRKRSAARTMALVIGACGLIFQSAASEERGGDRGIDLPAPKFEGKVSVEQALLMRRSVKEYRDEPLSLADVAQLLWAAQGINRPETSHRTVPSAGSTYPIDVYAIVADVKGIEKAAYQYKPEEHRLAKVKEGDVVAELAAALEQDWVGKAPLVIVFVAVWERGTSRFGDEGIKYSHMEVGHASQNVYLQAAALNLGTRVIGGAREEPIRKVLDIPAAHSPLYVMPVGKI
jgi:SagB-type dehydrogenase family enzyme